MASAWAFQEPHRHAQPSTNARDANTQTYRKHVVLNECVPEIFGDEAGTPPGSPLEQRAPLYPHPIPARSHPSLMLRDIPPPLRQPATLLTIAKISEKGDRGEVGWAEIARQHCYCTTFFFLAQALETR